MAAENSEANGWGAAWETTKAVIRTRCIDQSKTLRRQEDEETTHASTQSSALSKPQSLAPAHTRNVTSRPEMTSRNNSPNDARSLNDMLEKEAYEKGSKHDVNTAAFHRQWTPKNAAQWVEELKLQDRTDPSNPQNLPPGEADKRKPTTPRSQPPSQRSSRPCTSNHEPKQRQSKRSARATASCSLRQPPNATPTSHQRRSPPYLRVPPNRQEPSRAQDLTASRTSSIGSSRGHRPNPYPILTNVFNESRRKGELPEGIRRGIISVYSVLYILQNEGPRRADDPRNYRPITLILMRILAQRMIVAVLQFFSRDQNGFSCPTASSPKTSSDYSCSKN